MKIKIFILLIICFFIGYIMNTPTTSSTIRINKDKLDEFESEIIVDGNNYANITNSIESSTVNNIGKKGEAIIDKGFDFLFDIIKAVIN